MDETGSLFNQIEPAILETLQQSHVNAAPPPFPFEAVSQKLCETFQLDECEITQGTCDYKTHGALLNGLGSNPVSLPLEITPLEGKAFWIMATEDITRLLQLLSLDLSKKLSFSHPDLQKGAYRFVALQVLDILQQLPVYSNLSVKLADKTPFEETTYAIDISIRYKEDSFWGRLALSLPLKHAFENHFALQKISLKELKATLGEIFLPLSIQTGYVELNQHDLQNLQEGDYILPDKLHYNPKKQRGTLRINLGDRPLFIAKPKEEQLKLMDMIYGYEENHYG